MCILFCLHKLFLHVPAFSSPNQFESLLSFSDVPCPDSGCGLLDSPLHTSTSHRSQPWSATVSRLWNGMFSESVWSFEINWIFMWTNQTESDDHPCSGSPADLQRAKLGVKSNVLREDAYCADWQTMAWNTFQTNNLIIRNLQPQHAQCAPVCHRKPKIPRL